MKPHRFTMTDAVTEAIKAGAGLTIGELSEKFSHPESAMRVMVYKLAHRGRVFCGRKYGNEAGVYFGSEAARDAWQGVKGTIKAQQAARKATTAKAPNNISVVSVVEIAPRKAGAKLAGDPIITSSTKRTTDFRDWPTARYQVAPDLPPDPRYPSFSSEWRQLRGQA